MPSFLNYFIGLVVVNVACFASLFSISSIYHSQLQIQKEHLDKYVHQIMEHPNIQQKEKDEIKKEYDAYCKRYSELVPETL